MTTYFEETEPDRVVAEDPLGDAFLAGPARLLRNELHALRSRRFARRQKPLRLVHER